MHKERNPNLLLRRGDGFPCVGISVMFQFLSSCHYLVLCARYWWWYVSQARLLLPLTNIRIGLINFFVMSVTYIFFYRACKAQGLDRKTLPYVGYFQPYCAWVAAIWLFVGACWYGYTCYMPWSVSSFFSEYTMQIFIPPLFIIWKIVKKTKMVKPHEADLVWERPNVDAYEETFMSPPNGFWKEMGQMVGIKRTKGGEDVRRRSSVAIPHHKTERHGSPDA